MLFVVELLIGLYYLLKLGALNWSPADKKPKPKRLAAAPAGFNLADITRFNGIEELEVDPTGKIPAQLSGAMNQNPNNNAIK